MDKNKSALNEVRRLRSIVDASNRRVDELLALVPNKCFSDCTHSEQMRFTNLESALRDSRLATLAWREAKFCKQIQSTLPESERQILRCAPPFDAQAEHENDLRYESRVDYESWQYDGPEEGEE